MRTRAVAGVAKPGSYLADAPHPRQRIADIFRHQIAKLIAHQLVGSLLLPTGCAGSASPARQSGEAGADHAVGPIAGLPRRSLGLYIDDSVNCQYDKQLRNGGKWASGCLSCFHPDRPILPPAGRRRDPCLRELNWAYKNLILLYLSGIIRPISAPNR